MTGPRAFTLQMLLIVAFGLVGCAAFTWLWGQVAGRWGVLVGAAFSLAPYYIVHPGGLRYTRTRNASRRRARNAVPRARVVSP